MEWLPLRRPSSSQITEGGGGAAFTPGQRTSLADHPLKTRPSAWFQRDVFHRVCHNGTVFPAVIMSMEQIKREVREIESSLHSSRQLLYSLERVAERSITSEVDGIRTSLKKADHKIESVSSQVHAFRAQIEDVDNAERSVNMESQMTWLRDSLAKIVEDLEKAESSARTAIECTDTYVYKVMDLKQDVETNSSKLVEHHDNAAILLARAKSEVSASERSLLSIQEKVSTKEREINSKNTIATSKRQRKAVLERQCAAKRNDVAEARRQRERRKEQAVASTVRRSAVIVMLPN
jgi:chromosome segregation ATPase